MTAVAPTAAARRGERWAVLAAVWICCALYLPTFMERGWIPHDEGAFAHSAERVLQGELPHRDFDEIYTGGLSQLHAVAFALFGVRLLAIRFVLLGFALAFVPALYGIAVRLVPPVLAGLLTLTGVAWSLPNYFAGVPSWYNLFFATFGTLALLRHLEDGRRGWLVLAGLCGGLSILAKISGVYFVAAALLFLLHREQWLARGAPAGNRAWALCALHVLAAVVFAAALIRLFWTSLGVMELALFVLPGTALAALLPWFEIRNGHGDLAARARILLGLVLPFALGVVAPLALFTIPYVQSGAVGDLVRGVFILPARRTQSAAMALPPPLTLVAVVPYALLLLAPAPTPRVERLLALVLTVALAGVLAIAGTHPAVYQAVWYGVRPLVPLTVIAACMVLGRAPPIAAPDVLARQRLFLLVAVASMVSLVQFPYAFGIYFCYAAPLVGLALAAVVRTRPAPRLLHVCVLVFYLAFAVLWLHPGFIRAIGLRYIPDGQTARLELARGGLLVYENRKVEYEQLIALVRQHAGGDFIYATPDAPEVYFLAGRRNPTRTIFEIFDEPEGRTARILGQLETHDVKVVVVQSKPEFSPPLDPELAQGLNARFPFWQQVGRFQVGWRP